MLKVYCLVYFGIILNNVAMEYSEKVKKFLEVKGLNQMDLVHKTGKAKALISRWINAEKPSLEFLMTMAKTFPDFDLNYMLRDKPVYATEEDLPAVYVTDTTVDYGKSPTEIIEDIERKLDILKQKVAQNSHN